MLGFAPVAELALGSSGYNPTPPTPADAAIFPFETTIISQYANSPILLALIRNITEYIDPTANLNNFYDFIWNVDTARGYGLDVWGRIVGVQRVLHVAIGGYFGFAQDAEAKPFGHGVFYSGEPTTANFSLTDNAYRTLILAKALANITDCSIPAINQILINLFPNNQNSYVTDGLDMTLTYTFHGALSAVDLAIIQLSGVLPHPVGVLSSLELLATPITTEDGSWLTTEDGQTIVTEG